MIFHNRLSLKKVNNFHLLRTDFIVRDYLTVQDTVIDKEVDFLLH